MIQRLLENVRHLYLNRDIDLTRQEGTTAANSRGFDGISSATEPRPTADDLTDADHVTYFEAVQRGSFLGFGQGISHGFFAGL